jgi:hypothetical protein
VASMFRGRYYPLSCDYCSACGYGSLAILARFGLIALFREFY